MSRVARKIAEVRAEYEALPDDVRARFEEGLAGAQKALASADEIPRHLRSLFFDALMMAAVDGYVAKDWPKVRRALTEAWPRAAELLGRWLPDGPVAP